LGRFTRQGSQVRILQRPPLNDSKLQRFYHEASAAVFLSEYAPCHLRASRAGSVHGCVSGAWPPSTTRKSGRHDTDRVQT